MCWKKQHGFVDGYASGNALCMRTHTYIKNVPCQARAFQVLDECGPMKNRRRNSTSSPMFLTTTMVKETINEALVGGFHARHLQRCPKFQSTHWRLSLQMILITSPRRSPKRMWTMQHDLAWNVALTLKMLCTLFATNASPRSMALQTALKAKMGQVWQALESVAVAWIRF